MAKGFLEQCEITFIRLQCRMSFEFFKENTMINYQVYYRKSFVSVENYKKSSLMSFKGNQPVVSCRSVSSCRLLLTVCCPDAHMSISQKVFKKLTSSVLTVVVG